MGSDDKYGKIKPLVESNTIKRYSDIFEVAVTKSEVARDLKININRFTKLIASPGKFKMRQIIRQAGLFGLTLLQMTDLIEKEYSNKKESFDDDKKDSRYRQIKTMVRTGKIKRFHDIFEYVPRYVVARDIKKGRSNWTNYGNYTFDQIRILAKLCELSFMDIYQLITHP
jgi:hypothetical protein